MPALIKQGRVVENPWRTLPAGVAELPDDGLHLVPHAFWRVLRDAGPSVTTRLGVWLEPHDDPAELADDLDRLPVVAVRFPHFTDGRGYSTGRLLRERYRFAGELRAIGDVLRDQIFLLSRCGFDAFELREDQDAQAAIAALADFSEAYQAAIDRGALFERRPASKVST